jgi:hypothetical protein
MVDVDCTTCHTPHAVDSNHHAVCRITAAATEPVPGIGSIQPNWCDLGTTLITRPVSLSKEDEHKPMIIDAKFRIFCSWGPKLSYLGSVLRVSGHGSRPG